MAKEQVNFRINKDLLLSIKAAAGREDIPYTQWIAEACTDKLYPSKKASSKNEIDLYSKLYKRLSNELYTKLYNDLYSVLYSEVVKNRTPQFPNPTLDGEYSYSDKRKHDRELSKGISNAELARLIKVSSPTVSRWSTGKRQPPKNLNWEFKPEFGKWYEKGND